MSSEFSEKFYFQLRILHPAKQTTKSKGRIKQFFQTFKILTNLTSMYLAQKLLEDVLHQNVSSPRKKIKTPGRRGRKSLR